MSSGAVPAARRERARSSVTRARALVSMACETMLGAWGPSVAQMQHENPEKMDKMDKSSDAHETADIVLGLRDELNIKCKHKLHSPYCECAARETLIYMSFQVEPFNH